MLCLSSRKVLLGTTAAVALVLGASNGAQAQVSGPTTLIGGGSTLAALIYQTIFNTTLAAADPNLTIDYAAVGSGAGSRGVLCNDATQVGKTAGTAVQYGASDAPLPTSQETTWANSTAIMTGAGSACSPATTGTVGAAQGGPLIQLPTIGTPVTLSYFIPTAVGGKKPARANGALTLNDSQICGIFSGKITSWNDAALSGAYAATGTAAAPSGTINIVYRSDGSGTSALFTAHLAAVCKASDVPAGFVFTSTQTFAQLFSTLPTTFFGGSGSGGVLAKMIATPNSITYLSPDYTLEAGVNAGKSSFLPVAGVINHNTGTVVLPTTTATSTALNTAALPSATDGLHLLTSLPDPQVGYPIVGYTTAIFPTCFHDNAAQDIAVGISEWLNLMYTDAQTFGLIEGQGFVPLPTNLSNVIISNIINNTNGRNIDFDDATTCANFAGR